MTTTPTPAELLSDLSALIDAAVAEELERLDTCPPALIYVAIGERLSELRTTGNGQAGQKEEDNG